MSQIMCSYSVMEGSGLKRLRAGDGHHQEDDKKTHRGAFTRMTPSAETSDVFSEEPSRARSEAE